MAETENQEKKTGKGRKKRSARRKKASRKGSKGKSRVRLQGAAALDYPRIAENVLSAIQNPEEAVLKAPIAP